MVVVADSLVARARASAIAVARSLTRPPVGPRVAGVAERVDEVAIPGTFEVVHDGTSIERLPLDEMREEPVIVPAGLSLDQVASLELVGINRSRLLPFDGDHLQVSELV